MNAKIYLCTLLLTASAIAEVRVSVGIYAPPPPPDRIVVDSAPEPWLPSRRENTYVYYYYPDYDVYYRTTDHVWIYTDRGRWRTGPALPGSFRLDFQRGVVLRMGTDRPYIYHEQIVRRYPREYFEHREERREEELRAQHRTDEHRDDRRNDNRRDERHDDHRDDHRDDRRN